MNKILVGIIAAAIIGSMAFMQPTDALAKNCPGPDPNKGYDWCHLYYEELFIDLGCPNCGYGEFVDPTISPDDYLVIIDARIYGVNQKIDVLSDKLDTLSEDVNNISNGMQKATSDDDVVIIIIIIVASLVVISLGLQIAILTRKR